MLILPAIINAGRKRDHFGIKERTLLRTPIDHKPAYCQPAPQTITSTPRIHHVQHRCSLLTTSINKFEIVLAGFQVDLVAAWMEAGVDTDIAVKVNDLEFTVNMAVSFDNEVTVSFRRQELVDKLLFTLMN